MTVRESLPGIDAVRRTLEITELDAHVRVAMTLTTNISLAPAQLWPLLTTAEGLARWFGTVTGRLREGGHLVAPGGARARILEVEAPHRIVLAWQHGGAEDPLRIRLDPEDDGTTSLRLAHTTSLERRQFDRLGPGTTAVGWEIALMALAAATDGWRATCLQPLPMPTPQWLAGPDGAEHLRAWSVRWAAEAVAAGVDEEAARRGERETARAYGA